MLSNAINAIILGIIEGITEFLPVSSTGHLILVEDKLPLVGANSNTFMIAIQLGAIIAVIYLYPHVFKKSITPQHWFGAQNKRILLAISPALLCGFLAHSYIKTYLFSPKTVAMGLALGAILMLLSDYIIKRRPQTAHSNELADISTKQAFIVGVCQCMALWPGMSRSASTIMGGIWSGLSYDLSARFSFIIAVPVMVAAVSYDLLKTAPSLTVLDLQLIAIGFIVSFFVAIVAIKTFIQLLSKYKLAPFAVYRLVLVGLLILSGI